MHMNFQSRRWLIAGTIIVFCICTLFHFLYDLCQQNLIIGLLVPVNESVFEHLKMIPLPLFLWWIFSYKIYHHINRDSWFFGAFMAVIISMASVMVFYYLYSGMFGCENVFVDIFILAIAIFIGQLGGYRIYLRHRAPALLISVSMFLMIIVVFALFTVFPPQIPFFMDPTITRIVSAFLYFDL